MRQLILIFWVCVVVALLCPTFVRGADSPICLIDGQVYNHKAVLGATYDELKEEFNAGIKGYSDDQLKALLQEALLDVAQQGQELRGREAIEAKLFDMAYKQLLNQMTRGLLLSHMARKVVLLHGTKIEDYFDIKMMNEAIARNLDFVEFMYENGKKPAAERDALYEAARQKYSISLSKEDFSVLLEMVGRRPFYERWLARAEAQSPKVHDYRMEACAAHYLFKPACEEGVFRTLAKDRFQARNSPMMKVTISGYEGSYEGLAAFVSSVVDAEGKISLEGVNKLHTWFKKLKLPVEIKGANVPTDKDVAGKAGVLIKTGTASYEVYGWSKKVAREPANAQEQKGYEMFWKGYAYECAAEAYPPTFKPMVAGWSPNLSNMLQAVSVNGKNHQFPEVNCGNFVLKPYPKEYFEEIFKNVGMLEALAAGGAAASVKGDQAEMARIAAQAKAKGSETNMASLKAMYESLAGLMNVEMQALEARKRTQ